MKRLILLFTCLTITIAAFAQNDDITPAAPGVTYGDKVTADRALQLTDLNTKLGKDSVYKGKITGKVVEVCKKKGCFMTLQTTGSPIMVRFTDYAFFMPQNIVGKTVVVEGTATVKTIPVERLQHFAADAGKSKEEIAKITQPKKDIQIMADGVLVMD
ncbi:DUF4920 domain-containing protein [Mucilaginibacter limnophilus]|uniref:DUF4920 domain-containing protein n=1 Tax=Mucilaginibacter limnophilus TaxID=1932778 RepID=A0A437MZM0_9SPHI|nr:DUF4920 domain-containing protein [Mucilaginibacter limnophilus]RVU03066.1 DUF4920 domain-containing protein [Mucilaginibacter limnophilus]